MTTHNYHQVAYELQTALQNAADALETLSKWDQRLEPYQQPEMMDFARKAWKAARKGLYPNWAHED